LYPGGPFLRDPGDSPVAPLNDAGSVDYKEQQTPKGNNFARAIGLPRLALEREQSSYLRKIVLISHAI
jgi:hypothetical protein